MSVFRGKPSGAHKSIDGCFSLVRQTKNSSNWYSIYTINEHWYFQDVLGFASAVMSWIFACTSHSFSHCIFFWIGLLQRVEWVLIIQIRRHETDNAKCCCLCRKYARYYCFHFELHGNYYLGWWLLNKPVMINRVIRTIEW